MSEPQILFYLQNSANLLYTVGIGVHLIQLFGKLSDYRSSVCKVKSILLFYLHLFTWKCQTCPDVGDKYNALWEFLLVDIVLCACCYMLIDLVFKATNIF